MSDETAGPVSLLLQRLAEGDREVEGELYRILHEDLRRRARDMIRNQPPGHSLQSGDLVHEAWLRLVQPRKEWNGRAHFLRVAVRAMRSVLVDHARGKQAEKRGGDRVRIELQDVVAGAGPRVADVLDLDEGLQRLRSRDENLHRVAELHVFGGLTHAEIADVLGVSTRTVERAWGVARAVLAEHLQPR